MSYQKIEFLLDSKFEQKILEGFVKDSAYDEGRNLEWAVIQKYPQLQKFFHKSNAHNGYEVLGQNKIDDFLRSEYLLNADKFGETLKNYEQKWKSKEPKYLKLVGDLFGEFSWPNCVYQAYGTIWGMYPRFLEEKSFAIPLYHQNPDYVSVVIAHEMLHFVFYEYFYLKYPKYKDENCNFLVWNISEVFNTIIQNSSEWLDVFGLETMEYPEHEEVVLELASRYSQEKPNVDVLIDWLVKRFENF
jgi:hypothetical protein